MSSEGDNAPREKASSREIRDRLLRRIHRGVKEIEPWGILLALIAFGSDYLDRVEERTVRAWQLLTTPAPGNSGKREALEYLNQSDGLLCLAGFCLIPLKWRTPLTGIDLSPPDNGTPDDPSDDPPGAYLLDADLAGANLGDADLAGVHLEGAVLTDALLSEVRFTSEEAGPALNLTQAQIDKAWAWADEPPVGLDQLDPPLAFPETRLCNPALRSTWTIKVLRPPRGRGHLAPPAGCSGAAGATPRPQL